MMISFQMVLEIRWVLPDAVAHRFGNETERSQIAKLNRIARWVWIPVSRMIAQLMLLAIESVVNQDSLRCTYPDIFGLFGGWEMCRRRSTIYNEGG